METEIVEVVRQSHAGVSQLGIARATGLARETVKKYLAAAGTPSAQPQVHTVTQLVAKN